MKIRPRNIPKFQSGGSFNLSEWIKQNPEYYKWYSSIYPNAQTLQGSPLKQRNDLWNKNQLSSSHYTTDDLQRSAYNNYLYTNDYDARSEDLIKWGESQKDFGTISDRDFVNRYNELAKGIRDVREAPQTYNTPGYRKTNQDFRGMFYNRSRQGTNTPLYTIGYQDNIEDIEGTSTWQRRMDRYEKPFNQDTPEGQENRTFYITRPDGTKIKVFKKQNGDLGLFNDPNDPESPKDPVNPQNPENPNEPQDPNKQTQVPAGHQNTYGFDWGKINEGLQKVLGNPNLYAIGRLAGNLINNERVYDEQLKGIKPVLRQTYNTHRQVVGDEATKQAYYRRAAQGQTAAARPFTSDADRQMAYQMEAKRAADELRAQGDLADNQEIRRTSDESNQHQWANTQRATEVANANIASMNQANALIHNLLAQKHSAQWSSIDNYLKEIEYRKRQQLAEDQSIEDQLYMLGQEDFQYTPEYSAAYKKYNDILEKHKKTDGTYDLNDPEVIKAKGEFQNLLKNFKRKQLLDYQNYRRRRNLINFGKSGTKISYKSKDDLLYKSARDVVEHFRKMTKLSSDALNRKTPKIEKLTSHPKGSTKRYQQGGVAPFTVYTPVSLGGERAMSTQTDASGLQGSKSGSGTSKSKGSDTLDMVKTLFKEVIGKGLPSDVNSLYTSMQNLLNRAQAFGTELSTEDIASMYLSQMQQLNNIQYLKSYYDKAEQSAISNNAMNEFAVNSMGQLACQNQETGEIEYADSLKDAKEKGIVPLTNGYLLQLRAKIPKFAGRSDLDQVVANGIGMTKIAEFLKGQLPSLGESTNKNSMDGYTNKEAKDIKQGMELLMNAPSGDYKYTMSKMTKDQQEQAKKAISYLAGILPTNMKAILDARAEMGGKSTAELIGSLVTSGMDQYNESSIQFDAVTGKAAKDSDGKSKGSSSGGDIKSNFLDQLQRDQIGIDREFSMVTKDGNSKLYSLNSKYISQLPNVTEDMSLDKMLGESKIGTIMDSRLGVTFGDQVIDPSNFKDIMFDLGGGATLVTLPCKYENGHKVVNFAIKDEYDNAVKEVSKTVSVDYTNPRFIKALSQKLHEKGLDSLLKGDNLDPNMFGHFMVVSAYTTDRAKFNTDSRYIEKVKNPDKSLEERIKRGLSTNEDKNDYELDINDKWGIFELTYDDIYRGNIFIPLNNDPVSAQTGWGNDNIKLDETRNLAEQYQNYQKSSKQKDSSSNSL